jgi:FecR-like protein
MRTYRALCLLLMIVIACTLADGQNPEAQPTTTLAIGSATVSELKGEVSIRSPQGEPVSAQSGVEITPESRIETGKGSLLLNLADGSQVLVKSHSQVVLKAPDQDKGFSLELFLGKVVNKIQKRLGSTPSFRMGTPTAVITVRGTRFSVEVTKKERTEVDVFEGLVEVEGIGAVGPPVMIRPGFSTWVERNREPESPHQMQNLHEGPEDRTRQPGMERDDHDREQREQRPDSRQGTRPDQENEPH